MKAQEQPQRLLLFHEKDQDGSSRGIRMVAVFAEEGCPGRFFPYHTVSFEEKRVGD
jgi:hypothetical protein